MSLKSVSAVIPRWPLTIALILFVGTQIATAKAFWDIFKGSKNSSFKTLPMCEQE